jgi:DNA gyrase subunit A
VAKGQHLAGCLSLHACLLVAALPGMAAAGAGARCLHFTECCARLLSLRRLPAEHAIRQASDATAAGAALQAEPFGLSREQSEGVLGMTLRRLTSLESNKLQEEQAQLRAK